MFDMTTRVSVCCVMMLCMVSAMLCRLFEISCCMCCLQCRDAMTQSVCSTCPACLGIAANVGSDCMRALKAQQSLALSCLCHKDLQAFAERVMKSEQASKEPFKSSIENFYQTDSITRSSSVMAKCVQARKNMHVDTLSTAEMSSN